MTWIQSIFHQEKALIGLCHLKALPGDPRYDEQGGMNAVIEAARRDIHALQNGGIQLQSVRWLQSSGN